MTGIAVHNLSKKFGNKVAVDNLSFEIREGEIFGLLGPNGSGKTTTIRLLTSLIKPDGGSASVNGFDIQKDQINVRQSVGILTENPSLYENLTAYENLDFFAKAYGISDAAHRKEKIREILDFFGLWERRDDKAGTFSKGMKQKLAIARTLVHEPKILFLDEPSSGLGPAAAKEIRDMIERLGKKERRTVLLCTHHLEDAERLCNRVMIISKGMMLASGTPDELGRMADGLSKLEIAIWGDAGHMSANLNGIDSIVSIESLENRLIITLRNPDVATPEIVSAIVNAGGKILSVTPIKPSLEETYLKLTENRKEADMK